ncbi:acyl-CoA dehydrogenase family protein [Saccharothrix algeriensis]|uniref:Alkylation response protein AidB-like acyl-CoA dehydrogenase n=1 Tax=Saccharothrix algeriensis TaxID=173560 RepID=A0ABS2SHP7_9PSEU|nr:acyl-CoA dehydrogenase family protein [Saccharothrix algeriensis]MBM7814823.1 alkylation response protein AidB-like acyl-CoA dehydrogenase [Saccharothrix algeriensis]
MTRTELSKAVFLAREIARDVLAPQAAAVDEEKRWPAEGVAALRAALGGLVVPERFGGMGQGLSAVAQVGEATGRACASTSICFGMHLVGSAVIAAKATDSHRERYLAPIAEGRHLTTLALSEPGVGGEFWLPRTRMESSGADGLRLTGAKSFVTNGGHADSYVISTVATDPGAPPGEFSCAVVDADTPGLAWGAPWHGFGMRGNESRTLELAGVEVDRRQLLGEPGDEIWYVFSVVAPYFLMAMAGTYLGVAAAALDEARAHVTARRHAHSGRALAAQPLVQHRLGVMWARVERTRRLLHHAAATGEAGEPDALAALCSAKAEVAETAEAVVNDALTLTGGRGYSGDSALHRLLRDARAAHVMSPITDVLRVWVGKSLLGEPLLGD